MDMFDWDDRKSDLNRQARGFGFELASRVFAGRTIEMVDARFNYGELRMKAIGEAGGVVLTVIYTDRGDIRRIISARLANRRERELWQR